MSIVGQQWCSQKLPTKKIVPKTWVGNQTRRTSHYITITLSLDTLSALAIEVVRGPPLCLPLPGWLELELCHTESTGPLLSGSVVWEGMAKEAGWLGALAH